MFQIQELVKLFWIGNHVIDIGMKLAFLKRCEAVCIIPLVMNAEYDVVIIGSGPGGYVAAIRSGQLGLKTALVERDEVGGVCLNWGCIPSKALIKNAEVLSLLHKAEDYGFYFKELKVDFSKAIDRSRQVVRRLTRGVAFLLKKNGVEHISGVGTIKDNHSVEVAPQGLILNTKHIIVATGASPVTLPSVPVDGNLVITSREALEMKVVPDSLVIVGGGATAVEFAYVYATYGAKVTIVELLPHLLPKEDEELGQLLQKALSEQGIRVLVGSKVIDMTSMNNQANVKVDTPDGTEILDCDKVLVAVGITGNSSNIGLEGLGVVTERSFITVDQYMATNVPAVYAIGDVTGILPLAHVASAQGVVAVEHIAGIESRTLNYEAMPRAAYCNPQVASVGLTEKQANEQGYQVKVGRFPLQANGKALAIGQANGMTKLVVDENSGEIIGAHMIGPEASELIAEVSMVKMLEGTIQELGNMVHAHPTLSESVKEAALAGLGQAVHM